MKFSQFLFIGLFISFSVIAEDRLDAELSLALSRLLPDVEIDDVSPTPIDGLYQVVIGSDVIYMTRDGNYVIKGEIIDLEERRNLTEEVRADSRVSILNSIKEDDYIEFSSKNMQDAIYVFTDIDCGYCRKLHMDVPELNSLGVSVRYLAYPRAGVDSAVGHEMSSVWCAKDRQKALTAAKNRESIETASCDDPVAEQYAMGQQLGVRGTPAIYLQNGRMLPGYMPPNEIIKQLER
ncbi:MAG: thiol:disulfide interchange protein DsbC [marine bacterium B5-7]|nr:MAG: thiol:disulfide interchange protein DsbC [marine bacterium B5-7]